jgi:hypothetical protein
MSSGIQRPDALNSDAMRDVLDRCMPATMTPGARLPEGLSLASGSTIVEANALIR